MQILDMLDAARRETDVLEHPFYVRWNAGELTGPELAFYAGQYGHAVAALADASELAADRAPEPLREGLRRHAAEERAHVALWDAFAAEAGAPAEPEPLAQTEGCCHAWRGGEELLEHLAVLYVLESGQPAISRTKLAGLVDHYGYSPEGPATEYFRLHESLDVEHADQARELIASLLAEARQPAAAEARMLECARAALRGNWELLDGVTAGD